MVFIHTFVLNLHPNYKSNKGNLLRFFSHAICVFNVTKKPFVYRACSLLRQFSSLMKSPKLKSARLSILSRQRLVVELKEVHNTGKAGTCSVNRTDWLI